MRIAVLAITRNGVALAGRVVAALPGAQLLVPAKFRGEAEAAAPGSACHYTGKLADQMPALFTDFDGIVCIVSLGAVVRLIAPHLQNKQTDPAVVVIDEAGQFAIPVLSGHLGGANRLSGHLARTLGATAVLTTASDVQATIGVDMLGSELGWKVEATHDEIVRCSAALVNDDPVALVQEAGSKDWWRHHGNGRSGPLPANVSRFARLEDLEPERYAGILWISERAMPADFERRVAGKCVVYRPGREA